MIPCIGIASGLAAGNSGCGNAPLVLKENIPHLDWVKMIIPNEAFVDKYDLVASLNLELALEANLLAKQHAFFTVIGGDHSCGIGTWSGVAEAYRNKGDIGLIWIDAHMDSHTTATTPSGNIHGMPLAALLGFGDRRLTNILSDVPKLKASNVVLVGIRDFEDEEKAFLREHGVKIYYMDQVKKQGLKSIIEEIVQNFASRTVGYGVSFDLDSLDPSYAPAVGTPVEGGLDAIEFLSCFETFCKHPPLAFEFVEYNPQLDVDGHSLTFIRELFAKMYISVPSHSYL